MTITEAASASYHEQSSQLESLLSENQKALIRESFAEMSSRTDQLCLYFLQKLYDETEVSLENLPMELQEQSRMLISTIKIVVASLDRLELLVPIIRLVSSQQQALGLTRVQSDKFAEALLWSMEMTLLNRFSCEMKEAWQTLYALLADVMKR